jgi:Domain of unknown function DUF302
MRGFVQVTFESCKPPNQPLDTMATTNMEAALHTNLTAIAFPKGLWGQQEISIKAETNFNVTRRETSTNRERCSMSSYQGVGERGGKGRRHLFGAARLVMVVSGLLAALVPISVQSAESLQEKPIMRKQTITVEHNNIESAKSFADVRAALERSVPHLDPSLVKALDDGDVERADREKKEGPELSIFQVRDHGALLKIAGKARNALQYEIGNPVTASLMTRHRLSAALYAPIRVVLYENDAGHGVFEYDQPSTTFGQFGDEQVTAVARGLDAALARALLGAAE